MTRFTLAILLFAIFSQSVASAQSSLWTPLLQAQRAAQQTPESAPVTERYYQVDGIELRQRLSRAGQEGRVENNSEIQLPVENGVIQRFRLELSPIMAPALAARYPEIQTYKLRGIDNPQATGRLSFSPAGLHGMITSPAGSFFIDPLKDGVYRAYKKPVSPSGEPFHCGVKGHNHDTPLGNLASRPAARTPGSLRVYRLALATTGEYAEAIGSAIGKAVGVPANISELNDEIVIALNRVNLIYETNLAIRLVLIANNDLLIYTNKSTDPYSDPYTNPFSSPDDLLEKNEKNIRSVIGSANYDIGHLFSRGGGGLAEVGGVCVNGNNLTGDIKAGGVTGLLNPVGDDFYIDYVAHEMGHQFSAEHTFNGTDSGCGAGNRWQSTAFEPGSGSSIMSYAGICGDENISAHAIAMFHAGSINQINNFTSSGQGSSCGLLLDIGNPGQPAASAGDDFTIPAQTPFLLTAGGSDSDGDALTYSWDQMDTGKATNSLTIGTDLGNNSLFRSYLPRSQNSRHFPALGTTLKNQYDDSEVLACQTRNINFRVTVLDGNSGIASDDVRITVDGNSGPFEITSYNVAQAISSGQNLAVTWNVANTNQSPVNCARVDISLLTFNTGLTTYSENLLSAGEANDGSAIVFMPSNSGSTQARFKIQCSNNVFYDISDANLMITGGNPYSSNQSTVFYNQEGASYSLFDTPSEVCRLNADTDKSGGGALNLYWLMGLLSLLVIRNQKVVEVS